MQAIVLVGGLGTRLRGVVDDVPKPMAPVQGRPFLALVLDQLVAAGFTTAIFAAGYRHEAIRGYFARLPGSGGKVEIGEHRSMQLGSDAVLVAGMYQFTAIRDGQPVVTPARFTMVVTKRGADWLIAHHHSSRRPEPPK